MADEPLEDEPERLTEPADDDIVDVSIESPPTVWTTHKMKWSLLKSSISGTTIAADIIPIGDGTGIINGQWKSGDLDGDGVYLSNENNHTVSNYFGYHDKITGNSWLNGATEINVTVGGGHLMMQFANNLIKMLNGPSTQAMQIGNSISSPSDSKVYIKGSGKVNILDLVDSSETSKFLFTTAGFFGMELGTSVNEFSTDGTLLGDSDDVVPTEKAVKTYVDAQSGGGWLGSETRIKIAPWDVVSYNDKDGVSIQNNGGVVNDAAAKITTMVTGVFIPTGYRAVNFKINASANIAVELLESQIWDSTAVSKGSGNANSIINITNVDSTITNYLSIIIVEAGNDIYGGYITIEKI